MISSGHGEEVFFAITPEDTKSTPQINARFTWGIENHNPSSSKIIFNNTCHKSSMRFSLDGMFLPIHLLPPEWHQALKNEFEKSYFNKLDAFLKIEYSSHTIFPARENIFKAFTDLDLPQIKVVILGQDPYHGEGQAIGRAFAVPRSLKKKPPSLKNIFKELSADLQLPPQPFDSELNAWTQQGVFLMNTVLTVRSSEAFSHKNQGWELFTDEVLKILNSQKKSIHFVLWGAAAQSKKPYLTGAHHTIWESAHPSPLSASRGFLGSKIFSKINNKLNEQESIRWEEAFLAPES